MTSTQTAALLLPGAVGTFTDAHSLRADEGLCSGAVKARKVLSALVQRGQQFCRKFAADFQRAVNLNHVPNCRRKFGVGPAGGGGGGGRTKILGNASEILSSQHTTLFGNRPLPSQQGPFSNMPKGSTRTAATGAQLADII